MKQFLIIISILLSFTVFGQEELRYEDRQFFKKISYYENGEFKQVEKQITYKEFRDIILNSKHNSFGFWDCCLNASSTKYLRPWMYIPYLILAGTTIGGVIGGNVNGLMGLMEGGIIGFGTSSLIGITFRISDYNRFSKAKYFQREEKKFKRIIKRYNKSLIST